MMNGNVELIRSQSDFGTVSYHSLDSIDEVKNTNKYEGYAWLLFSAFCSAFGNSLEPISTLSWLSTPTLLIGLFLCIGLESSRLFLTSTLQTLLFIVVTQGIAFMIGFLTLFSAGEITTGGIVTTFLVGCIEWLLVTIFCLVPLISYVQIKDSLLLSIMIFPVTFTTLQHTIIGRFLGTFQVICNSVLYYAPLRQLASITGICGITFMVTLIGSCVAITYISSLQSPTIEQKEKLYKINAAVVKGYLLLTVLTG